MDAQGFAFHCLRFAHTFNRFDAAAYFEQLSKTKQLTDLMLTDRELKRGLKCCIFFLRNAHSGVSFRGEET